MLAVVAAFFLAGGSVVQQHTAAEAPPEHTMSLRLLWWLVRRRLWMAGIGLMIVGDIVSAVALGDGSVALVEPLLVVRLLFAVPMAAVWMRRRVSGRDWTGAAATSVGLAVFVLAGHPHEGPPGGVPAVDWVIGGGTVVALALGLALLARHLDPVRRAALLGAGAGMLFGLQAALTHSAIGVLSADGVIGLLEAWQTYCIGVVAVVGILLNQSAFQAAPLPASFPVMTAAEPLAGIAVGVGVLDGALRLTPAAFAVELVGLAVMVGGIYLLASSPLVTGQVDLFEARHEEGLAVVAETGLERELRALHHELDVIERRADHSGRMRWTHRRVNTHLRQLDQEIDRLCVLQDDIARLRTRERERSQRRPAPDRVQFERADRDLDTRQQEINTRADELRGRSRQLRQRAETLFHAPIRPAAEPPAPR